MINDDFNADLHERPVTAPSFFFGNIGNHVYVELAFICEFSENIIWSPPITSGGHKLSIS